ncbi:MAG: archease [Acidimicrobiia bacterium]|nr:archease [Acidimicrobiia bacterium]
MTVDPNSANGPDRGHRARPHTADVILEAWGPDLAVCCEEAATALLAVCLDPAVGGRVGRRRSHVMAGTAESLLLAVLDEVIFVLDTSIAVPVRVEVQRASDNGLDVHLEMAPRDSVAVTGPAPKAIAVGSLSIYDDESGARCSFLVDV